MHSHMNRTRRKPIVKPAQLAEKKYSDEKIENGQANTLAKLQFAIEKGNQFASNPHPKDSCKQPMLQANFKSCHYYQTKQENHLKKTIYDCLFLCVNVQLNQCQAAAVLNDFLEISIIQKIFQFIKY